MLDRDVTEGARVCLSVFAATFLSAARTLIVFYIEDVASVARCTLFVYHFTLSFYGTILRPKRFPSGTLAAQDNAHASSLF